MMSIANKKKMHSKRWAYLMIALSILWVGFVIYQTIEEDLQQLSFKDFFLVVGDFFIQWPYLLLALLMVIIVLATASIKFSVMIHAKTGRWSIIDALKLPVVGKYYENITPYGAGGQPYQIYHLRKTGMSLGQATAIPVINYAFMRLTFGIISLLFFIFFPDAVSGWIRIAGYAGILISSLIPVTMIAITLSTKATNQLLRFAQWLLRICHIRRADFYHQKLASTVTHYQHAIAEYRYNKTVLGVNFWLSLVSHLAMASIAYFVMKATPINQLLITEIQYLQVTAMFLYAANFIAIVPTPGGAGAAEFSFVSLFGLYIGGTYLVWAMLLWRFFSFYFIIFLGLPTVIISALKKRQRPKYDSSALQQFSSVQFIDNFYPLVDGVIKVVDSYATILNENGIPTKVVAPYYRNYVDQSGNYPVIRIPSVKLNWLEYEVAKKKITKAIEQQIVAQRPAVFHAHAPFIVGHIGLKLAKKHQIPIIATFHSKFYDDFLQVSQSPLISKLALRYVVKFFRDVDEVWVCNEGAGNTLRQYGYHGPYKVMVNGTNFVYPNHAEALRKRALAKYQIEPEHKVIIFVGHLIWQKNIRLILKTMHTLVERGENYRLLMVGDGGNEAEIKAYAAEHNLLKDVTFAGMIFDREELQSLYLAADLFFFPSVYDNAPLVLREASVMKVPSLLIRGSNSASVIVENDNGYLADANSDLLAAKIVDIFKDKETMKAIGVRASETIPIAWHKIVDKVEEEYASLLQRYYEDEKKNTLI